MLIWIFFSIWLQNLYNYGARKIALIGVGQIGCSPNELAQNSPDGKTCVQRINSANQMFNNKLKSLVVNFNKNLPNAKFTYINAYGIFQDLIDNPSAFGNSSRTSLIRLFTSFQSHLLKFKYQTFFYNKNEFGMHATKQARLNNLNFWTRYDNELSYIDRACPFSIFVWQQ